MSAEEAIFFLKSAGIAVARPYDSIPQSHLAVARAALELRRQTLDARRVSDLALRAGMPEEEVRSRLLNEGVLKKRRLKRVAAGKMRHAEEVLGLRAPETAPEKQPDTPAPETQPDTLTVKPARKRRESRPKIIGKEQPISHLTPDDIANIHWVLVNDFRQSKDPIDPPGVRDQSLLESAAHRPKTALGATDKYPTAAMACAALLHSIVQNHAFHNGNKRTALVAALVFADKNGYRMRRTATEEKLYNLLLKVASHDLQNDAGETVQDSDAEVLCIAKWIHGHLRVVEKQEHPVKWKKFRQMLNGYNCNFNVLPGNKINIEREVDGRPLWTQVAYRREGAEVEVNTVKKVRQDLELGEEHGYPSDIFYEQGKKIPEFINKYRTLLRRLAKV